MNNALERRAGEVNGFNFVINKFNTGLNQNKLLRLNLYFMCFYPWFSWGL